MQVNEFSWILDDIYFFTVYFSNRRYISGWHGSRVVSVLDSGAVRPGMLSGTRLRQTFHSHHASVHEAAKLVAALSRVARVTAGLAESTGSLPPGLWLIICRLTAKNRDQLRSGTLRSVIKYGLPLPFRCISVDAYRLIPTTLFGHLCHLGWLRICSFRLDQSSIIRIL